VTLDAEILGVCRSMFPASPAKPKTVPEKKPFCKLHPDSKIKHFQVQAYPNVIGNITVDGVTAPARTWARNLADTCQKCWDEFLIKSKGAIV